MFRSLSLFPLTVPLVLPTGNKQFAFVHVLLFMYCHAFFINAISEHLTLGYEYLTRSPYMSGDRHTNVLF